jgi:hypothetical protein
VKDDEYASSFLHLIEYSHGGKRESIEDEKHSDLFDYPEFCSDRVFHTVMDENHLIQVHHVNSCADGLKCLSYLQKKLLIIVVHIAIVKSNVHSVIFVLIFIVKNILMTKHTHFPHLVF